MIKNNYLMSLLCVLALCSCTSKKAEKNPIYYPEESPSVTTTKANPLSVTAKQTATEEGTTLVTELIFQKGKAGLSSSDQQKIKKLYLEAVKKGKIKEVQLIAWADQELPSEKKKELAKNQKDLVDKRNHSIEKLILQLNSKLKVTKISMAERAGTLSKFMASEDAEVKESLDVKDAPGKTGQAMVIFLLEN